MRRADFYLCRLALVAGLAFAVLLLCVANPSEAATAGLLANGVGFIVEALGATHAIVSVPPIAQAEVPYGLTVATFGGRSGCTDEQLVDPEIAKSDLPTTVPGGCWDTGGLGRICMEFARDTPGNIMGKDCCARSWAWHFA